MIDCFLIEPTNLERVYLRRYVSRDGAPKCSRPNGGSYHDAMTPIGDVTVEHYHELRQREIRREDPLWPKACACGYAFAADDQWQVFGDRIYAKADGQKMVLRDAPQGAMWFADWLHDIPSHCGPDGRALIVRLPGGHDWAVDGKASNCDQPGRPHKCWVRRGEPPAVTVDKGRPSESCNAGAGSILVPGWHGFLRNGKLVGC